MIGWGLLLVFMDPGSGVINPVEPPDPCALSEVGRWVLYMDTTVCDTDSVAVTVDTTETGGVQSGAPQPVLDTASFVAYLKTRYPWVDEGMILHVLRTTRVPLPPVDSTAPEPIKALLTQPTTENALRFLLMMEMLNMRGQAVAAALKTAGVILGLDNSVQGVGFQNLKERTVETFRDSVVAELAKHAMLITTYPPDHPYGEVINQALETFSRKWGFMVVSKYEGNGFPVVQVPFRDNLMLVVDIRTRKIYVLQDADVNESSFRATALLIESGIHEAVDPALIVEGRSKQEE